MYTKDKKVDVFVIGAQKAGTTTIHEIFKKEFEISLPNIKETHFFSDIKRYEQGMEWYNSNFDSSKRIWLEVDPDYSSDIKIIKKLHEYNPNAKIIFIYRDPIKRAISQWQMNKRRGIETLNFNQALQAEGQRLELALDYNISNFGYFRRSNYKPILEEVLKYYSVNALVLVDFEIFKKDEKISKYKEICRFVGIETSLVNDDLNVKSNVRSEPKFKFLAKFLWSNRKIRIGKLLPFNKLKLKIAMWLDKLNNRPVNTGADNVFVSEEITERFSMSFDDFSEYSKKMGIKIIN